MNVEIKQLPMDEYNSLKSEIINRINIMNTQASTAISLIIAIWAAGFGLLGIQLSNLEDLSMAQNLALSFGQIGVFILSNVILLPMAIKSGENLRQMVSLGAYIQVFFEYLSHKNGLPTQFTWETSDKAINSVINSKEYRCRDYLFNSEYTILGIISLLFILIEIPLNYSFSNHVIDNVPLAIIYVAVILFSVFLIWKIYCYSSSKKNINIMREKYLKVHLISAVKNKLISKYELSNAFYTLLNRNNHDVEEYEAFLTEKSMIPSNERE